MKKFLIYMMCLFCMTAAGCGKAETLQVAVSPGEEVNTAVTDEGHLRYDGLYCYIFDDNADYKNSSLLRFYEDGGVIIASIQASETSSYFPRGDWFRRESPRYANLIGTYTLTENNIELTTVDESGTIDFQGTAESDRLVLDFHSNINGNSGTGRVYDFYSFDELPEYVP